LHYNALRIIYGVFYQNTTTTQYKDNNEKI